MASAYLGKICVHFLEMPILKRNENTVLLFENSHNKKNGPFLFEKWYFLLGLFVALIF